MQTQDRFKMGYRNLRADRENESAVSAIYIDDAPEGLAQNEILCLVTTFTILTSLFSLWLTQLFFTAAL